MGITMKKGRSTKHVETQGELDELSLDGYSPVGGGVIADGSEINKKQAKRDVKGLEPETYADVPVENLVEQIKARGLATDFGVEAEVGELDLEKVDADVLRAGLIADDEKNAANA